MLWTVLTSLLAALTFGCEQRNSGPPVVDPSKTLAGHKGTVHCITLSPDGKSIASAGADKSIRIWETESGKPIRTLTGHDGAVLSASFSPDGKWLASFAADGTARVWDWRSGKEHERLELPAKDARIGEIRFSHDGRRIAACGGNAIRVWDFNANKPSRVRFTVGPASVWMHTIIFLPNDKDLLSNVSYGTSYWDVESKKERDGPFLLGARMERLTLSPDGDMVGASGGDHSNVGVAMIWSFSKGKQVFRVELNQASSTDRKSILAMSFSPDSKFMALGGFDQPVGLWRIADAKEVARFERKNESCTSIAFSSDGKSLITAEEDGSIRFWRIPEIDRRK